MNDTFKLHERLEADTYTIGDLEHCRVLLMNDSRYPWAILVPSYPDLVETFDLPPEIRLAVFEEANGFARAMKSIYSADKMNIATLGNMVPQLHIHVVARKKTDAGWPGPVWRSGPAVPYGPPEAERMIAGMKTLLTLMR